MKPMQRIYNIFCSSVRSVTLILGRNNQICSWEIHTGIYLFFCVPSTQQNATSHYRPPPAAEAVKNNYRRQAFSWRITFSKNYSRAFYSLLYCLRYFQGVLVRIPFSDCFTGLQSYAFSPSLHSSWAPAAYFQLLFTEFLGTRIKKSWTKGLQPA